MSRVVLGKVTYAAAAVKATWVKVLNANPRRKFAQIVNASDEDMWLQFVEAGGAPTGGAGLGEFVAADGFGYSIDNDNMWYGEVWMIHAGSGDKVASTMDGV